MPSPNDHEHDAPLAGVNVVEFAQNAAVPQCGRLLAGMGARVVKVEPPTGDSMRHLAPLAPEEGRAYASINPNKEAICVDLTHPDAEAVVDALLQWADIALVGLKQADLPRFGLDWDRVHTTNPKLVYLVLTAFGPLGPDADEGGYDVLAQGLSGVGFSMNRSGGTAPMPTRPAVFDFASGAIGATAVLAALRHVHRTGVGQRVDASLLGTAMSLGTPMLARFDQDAERLAVVKEEIDLVRGAGADFDTQRELYEARVIAGAGAFRLYFRHYLTADGVISVAGLSPALMTKFHTITGIERPTTSDVTDPGFQQIVAAAEELFVTKSTQAWLDELRTAGYPCCRYNLPYEALEDPQVEANDYVVDLEHPTFGGYRTVGMPFGMSASSVAIDRASPVLDEHTDAVMAEVGFTADEAAALRAEGVTGRSPA